MKVSIENRGEHTRLVKIYKIENRKRIFVKYMGSAKTDEELDELLKLAQEEIQHRTGQFDLFSATNMNREATGGILEDFEYLGHYYTFLYNTLSRFQNKIGFYQFKRSLINDLVIMRLMEPASKLRSIELLEQYFGIHHRRQGFYEEALQAIESKQLIEEQAVQYAEKEFGFDYAILFYDVTTLYFETFTEDDLRKNGFSKDNKIQQPQILIALIVSKEGFPVSYEIFNGSTFEGHTLIPSIKKFRAKNKVGKLIVVADAAMISADNIEALKQEQINYIVGARLGNVSRDVFENIDKTLKREDAETIRLETSLGSLICGFSMKRYKKDKYEMEKQIENAKKNIIHKKQSSRIKYVSVKNETKTLNEQLIEKNKKLLGIKGYYTDLKVEEMTNQKIIERYHELYKIEQAFRVAKSDLQIRPIFHFKEEPIQLHILICFMALVMAKAIEIKTNTSLRHFITEFKKITTARLKHIHTGNEHTLSVRTSPSCTELMIKIGL